jgi:hypothetical protein
VPSCQFQRAAFKTGNILRVGPLRGRICHSFSLAVAHLNLKSGRMATLPHNPRQWIVALIATQLFPTNNLRQISRGQSGTGYEGKLRENVLFSYRT